MKHSTLSSSPNSGNTIVSRSQFKPMLFSTDMVKAILSGRKTQTRRVKGLKNIDIKATEIVENNGWPKQGNFVAKFKYQNSDGKGNPDAWEITNIVKSPCKIGDIIWVRETWMDAPNYPTLPEKYYYKASASEQFLEEWAGSWRPSLFMKKETCRLFLEVTDLRVEKLQSITEGDAEAEGVKEMDGEPVYPKDWKLCPACGGEGVHGALGESLGYMEVDCSTCDTYKKRYQHLWNSINGNWEENPYVWVITFKVVECPQGFC